MAGPWRTFVALGDSLTEGVGDPVPGGRLRGWAERLAEGLRELEPGLRFTNLARRSLVTAEIRDAQLDRALALRPELASAIVGMNDAIKPGFDPASVEEPLEEMVAALSDAGATVLLATLPDVTRILPLPRRITRGFHDRLRAVGDAVRRVAARHAETTVLVDAEDQPEELRRSNWSLDQLHPNSRGHLLIARGFAERLGERAGVQIPLPALARVPVAGRESLRHARWLMRNVGVPEARRFVSRVRRGAPGP